jgi:hypothetical protein
MQLLDDGFHHLVATFLSNHSSHFLSALFILATIDFQGIFTLKSRGNTQVLIKFFYHPYHWLYMRALEGNTSRIVLLGNRLDGLTNNIL